MYKGLVKGLVNGLDKGLRTGVNGIFGGLNSLSDGSVYDVDAMNYINRLVTLGASLSIAQKQAINRFVVQGKGQGRWYECDVIYPFIGGTASTHSVNMKAPGGSRDVTWSGVVLHSALGVVTNTGLFGYGNTNFNPSVGTNKYTQNSSSFGFYANTRNAASGAQFDMGVWTSAANGSFLTSYYTNGASSINTITGGVNQSTGSFGTTNEVPNAAGMTTIVRTASNALSTYRNGRQIKTYTNASQAIKNLNFYVVSTNENGTSYYPSPQRHCFAYIGSSRVNQRELFMEVENLQVVLGRSAYGG